MCLTGVVHISTIVVVSRLAQDFEAQTLNHTLPPSSKPLQRNLSLFSNDWHQSLGCASWESADLPTRTWGSDNGSIDLILTAPSPAPVNMKKKCCWLLTGMPACSHWVEFKPRIDYPNQVEQCFCLLRFTFSSSGLCITPFCTKHKQQNFFLFHKR